MTRYTLISFKLCPYVQRVAIALAEKRVPFDIIYVDLDNKPDWFSAISPLGKVPLLKIDDGERSVILFESSVILEYLDDAKLGRAMQPADPVDRALNRAWMEFGSSLLADIWALETATEEQGHAAALLRIVGKFRILEAKLGPGPYFRGSDLSFVDAVIAPAFRYFDVFDQFFDKPPIAAFPKVSEWRRYLSLRPSVQSAVVPEYGQLLTAFLRDRDAYMLRQGQATAPRSGNPLSPKAKRA